MFTQPEISHRPTFPLVVIVPSLPLVAFGVYLVGFQSKNALERYASIFSSNTYEHESSTRGRRTLCSLVMGPPGAGAARRSRRVATAPRG